MRNAAQSEPEASRPTSQSLLTRSRPRSTLDPRGLSRADAAAYLGVSATLFGQLVEAGVFPAPKRLAGRCVWDRLSLDRAFDDLPEVPNPSKGGAVDPWKDVAV